MNIIPFITIENALDVGDTGNLSLVAFVRCGIEYMIERYENEVHCTGKYGYKMRFWDMTKTDAEYEEITRMFEWKEFMEVKYGNKKKTRERSRVCC